MTAPLALPPDTLAAFGGDELRARVFYEKYSLRGPDGIPSELTPDLMWDRIARGLADVEPDAKRRDRWYHEFRWLLGDFRFLPGGRILHAVGQGTVGRKAVPTNCFVLPLQDDSLPAIYELAKEMAITYSRGGGVGIDISKLRPKGALVHNAAHASTGAVSFMETFSLVTGTIGQSGRRGALMITIRDDHPDVLDFVRIKRDKTSVRYANISVLVSDAFMRAVAQDGDWRLHYENADAGVAVERTIKARELWDELIQGAHDWAEPGCLFIDTARRLGTTEYNGMNVLTTNPCLRGPSRILTRRGLMRIADLNGQSVEIYAGDGAWRLARIVHTGRQPVYRLQCSNGLYLDATADHRIKTCTDEVTVHDALGVSLRPLLAQQEWDGEATIDETTATVFGFIQGDAYFKNDGGLGIKFGPADSEALTFVTDYLSAKGFSFTLDPTHLYIHRPFLVPLRAFGFRDCTLPDRTLPDQLFTQPPSIVKAFLRGLFSANGSVILSDTGRVTLKTTCRQLVEDTQQLLSALGMSSYITTNHPATIEFDNGAYTTRESYDLNIPGRFARMFAERVGFLQTAKNAKTRRWSPGAYWSSRRVRVTSVTHIGDEDVYDFAEPITHWGWVNGLQAHNCGEQFLDPYNNCDLGSINLLSFTRQPFAEVPPNQNLDWDTLRRAVRAGVRFLDNVLTYADPLFPLEAQREAAGRSRRIGLGITGLGDLLASLQLRYDSDEAIAFTNHLMEFIKVAAYEVSADLAEEKGAFPAFDTEKHLTQAFFRDFPEALLHRIRAVGLRNVALMTVPPTGSISAMAGVTSGIEPMFALTYLRRSESLSRGRFTVVHPLAETYFRTIGAQAPDLAGSEYPDRRLRELLPDFFVTAHGIDPLQRVRMQAAIAKHVDNSVSSTINLPNNASVETVERVYRLAWQLGCKGITVYREGSREGILITEEEARHTNQTPDFAERLTQIAQQAVPAITGLDGRTPDQQIEHIVHALADKLTTPPNQLTLTAERSPEPLLPRPESLSGLTHKVRTKMGTMFVTVNELDGQPVEVFCRVGKGGSHAEADSEMAGRLISLALRVQTPSRTERLELIAEQLDGIGGGDPIGFGPNRVRSIGDGIAKALYKHLTGKTPPPPEETPSIADGAPEATSGIDTPSSAIPLIAGGSNGNLCPRCHQYSLIIDEGCTKCRECGYKEC